MAIMDTHEAVKQLRGAGFDEAQAEAVVRVVGTGQDSLATNADLETQTLMIRSDLQALEQATKADLQALEQSTKADLQALEQSTKAELQALEQSTKAELQALEQSTKAELQAHAQANKADLEALELRLRHDLTLRLGAMVFAAAGAQVVIVVFLLTQFFAN